MAGRRSDCSQWTSWRSCSRCPSRRSTGGATAARGRIRSESAATCGSIPQTSSDGWTRGRPRPCAATGCSDDVGHIQRRGKDRWRARYVGPDGRERSKTFPRRADAERFLAGIEADKLRGRWCDPRLGRLTFGKWVEEWRGSATLHLKPKTVEGYESLLRCYLLPEFRALPVDH